MDDNCDGLGCARQGVLDLSETSMTRWTGEAPGDRAGASVAAVGDVSGDGLGDALIAAPAADPQAGRVYLIESPMEGRTHLSYATASFRGRTNGLLGKGLVMVIDGTPSVLLGAPRHQGAGALRIVDPGAPEGTLALLRTLDLDSELGRALVVADLNHDDVVAGDGLDDLAVGAYGDDTAWFGSGAFNLLPGLGL